MDSAGDALNAIELLRIALADETAEFREGQAEAIADIVDRGGRHLLVQRTGWGKSMVYFIATKLLRMGGAGPTLMVSPLLSLMRDQVLAAKRLGLRPVRIDSSNTDEWKDVVAKLEQTEDAVDILMISPERLANQQFVQEVFPKFADRMQLLVIDEAHCISDWGHDFRPDYRRIQRVLQQLPADIRVLATTATANERVVEDLEQQIGPNLHVSRGDLVRKSLSLQATRMPSLLARYAWLADALHQLPGSGIIYVLTVREAHRLARWLQSEGHAVLAYTGQGKSDEREVMEQSLRDGTVKGLVATAALGMGFDKPDLGFVVHLQRPQSAVHYYQQVGRAGRAIPEAIGVLLSGQEDRSILEWFVKTAFPAAIDIEKIIATLHMAGDQGSTISSIQAAVNVRWGRIEHAVKFLSCERPAPVRREGSRWFANPVGAYSLPLERMASVNGVREFELAQMEAYLDTTECLMMFLQRALDDAPEHIVPCGRCSVCTGGPLIDVPQNPETVQRARVFLDRQFVAIKPRKRWPQGMTASIEVGWNAKLKDLVNEPGYALCHYSDPIRGEAVRSWKGGESTLPEHIVQDLAGLVNGEWKPSPCPSWIACVPSLRTPERVRALAGRISKLLGIPSYSDVIRKIHETQPQKLMANSQNQVRNLLGAFAVDLPAEVHGQPVFLVDDIVDSGWTMCLLGAMLREAGAGPVFPLAVGSTSNVE